QRVEAVDAGAYDLLREQRVMARAFTQPEKVFARLGSQDFLTKLVCEFALKRRLHNAREADLTRDMFRALFADVERSRDWNPSLFALTIEQILVEDALDGLDIRKRKNEILAKLACVTRDRENPFIETRKQDRFLFQRRAYLEQQVDEATLVVKRIRTPAGNRRVSRVQPVTGLVLIEPDDRHASAAERTRDRKSGDVTVEHQRRPHFCRADLLAYGGDELATIIDHGLESSRGNSRG